MNRFSVTAMIGSFPFSGAMRCRTKLAATVSRALHKELHQAENITVTPRWRK